MTKVKDIEHRRKREIIEGAIQTYKMDPKCPFCGKDDLIRGHPEDDFFPEIIIPVDCVWCEKKWYEVCDIKELWIRSRQKPCI